MKLQKKKTFSVGKIFVLIRLSIVLWMLVKKCPNVGIDRKINGRRVYDERRALFLPIS